MAQLHERLTGGTARVRDGSPAIPSAVVKDIASVLAQVQQRLDVVTTILGGWIWQTDAEHRFIYMSPSVERYAGKKPEWHYGKTRQDLGNISVQSIDGKNWQNQLDERQSFGPLDFIRYQNGEALWMRTIGHPQFDADGNFTGYIGVAYELPVDAEMEAKERRADPRKKVVRAAELSFSDGTAPVACVLVDISRRGARVQVPPEVDVPRRCRLKVEALGLDTPCLMRWRRADAVGLQFEN